MVVAKEGESDAQLLLSSGEIADEPPDTPRGWLLAQAGVEVNTQSGRIFLLRMVKIE